MTALVLFIIIVVGIIQLFMFVKIWVMTNDVKKIREKYTSTEADFSEYILQGKKDEAYNLLVDNLYQRLYYLRTVFVSKDRFINKATPVIEEYKPYAALTGKALPEQFADPEKFYDKFEEVKSIVLWKP